MKNINILRGYTGLHAFFPSVSKNVQEVQPVNKATVSVTRDLSVADRPNLLSKRSARWARRSSH
nr:hypothetical protein [Hyphomonas sp. Mor2]